MKTIHKYMLVPFTSMPKGAEILHIAKQDEFLRIWALVDPANELEERKFRILGTGWATAEEGLQHLATYQDGEYVWHVFEVIK